MGPHRELADRGEGGVGEVGLARGEHIMYFESEITVPIRQLLRSLLNLAEFFLKLPSLSPRRLSLSPGVQYLHLGELHDEDPSSAEISRPEIRERSKSIQVPYLSRTYLRGSARQITPDMCAEVTPPPRPGSAPWCSWADSFAHLKAARFIHALFE